MVLDEVNDDPLTTYINASIIKVSHSDELECIGRRAPSFYLNFWGLTEITDFMTHWVNLAE